MTEFDYIVIGAGSAGWILADRLTESGQQRGLLLEAGAADRSLCLRMPLGFAKLYQHPKYNWRYSTTPQAELANQQAYTPRGKVLGGSGAPPRRRKGGGPRRPHNRPGLRARPGRRLRRLGRARQPRLGLRRPAALVQTAGITPPGRHPLAQHPPQKPHHPPPPPGPASPTPATTTSTVPNWAAAAPTTSTPATAAATPRPAPTCTPPCGA